MLTWHMESDMASDRAGLGADVVVVAVAAQGCCKDDSCLLTQCACAQPPSCIDTAGEISNAGPRGDNPQSQQIFLQTPHQPQ